MNQNTLFPNDGKRLFLYGTLYYHPHKEGWFVAKAPGQTVKHSKEDVEQYILNNTIGKLRGLDSKDGIIFIEDVTELAEKYNFTADNDYKDFDDFVRKDFPNFEGRIINAVGGGSDEVLEFDGTEYTKDEIKYKILEAVEKVTNRPVIVPYKTYNSRNYFDNIITKLSDFETIQSTVTNSDVDLKELNRFLLGACTGSGKETSTLSLILFLHDKLYRQNKIDKNTLHLAIATIPDTGLELIEELSSVSGMQSVKHDMFFDYERYVVYVIESYHNTYFSQLSNTARLWARKNVKVVKSISDIPIHSDSNTVPIVIGSFHDVGLTDSGNLKKKYATLETRIGVLSIGEAHQLMSNDNNKMWTNINNLNRKFLLLVTGTPYDYIFNSERQLYFADNEREMYTYTHLMRDKRENKDSAYKLYPDILYYGMSIGHFIQKMKEEGVKTGKWEGDEHAFTEKKLLTTFDENGDFLYKDAIVFMFQSMFGTAAAFDGFTGKPVGININTAPNLCDYAKRHTLVALPTGKDGVSVDNYIPKLVKLLRDSGKFNDYKLLSPYGDDFSEIKKVIETDDTKTITFTCNQILTGKNVPQWGCLLFFRSIGNSIKFLEQAIGRLRRAYAGKPNCGVFVFDIDALLTLEVGIQEALELQQKNPKPLRDIVEEILDNYNPYIVGGGEWKSIEIDKVIDEIYRISVKDLDGIGRCVKALQLPDGFNPKNYDNLSSIGSSKRNFEINKDDDAIRGKDSQKKTVAKQGDLELDDEKREDYTTSFKEMVRVHLAKMIQMAYIYEKKTIQEVVELVIDAIDCGNVRFLSHIGAGYELIPQYINDTTQIDIALLNRYIDRLHSVDLTLYERLELLESRFTVDKNKACIPTPNRVYRRMIDKLINRLKRKPKKTLRILDPAAGRGVFLIYLMNKLGEENIYFDVNNIYYNDADYTMHKLFTKINREYGIGIPDENIFNDDFLNPSKKFQNIMNKKFDVVLGNPPYESNRGARNKKLWFRFSKKAVELSKYAVLFITPNNLISDVGENGKELRKIIRNSSFGFAYCENHGNTVFTGYGVETCEWLILKKIVDEIDPILIKKSLDVDEKINDFEADIVNKVINSCDKTLRLELINVNIKRDDLSDSGTSIYFSGDKKSYYNGTLEGSNLLKVVFPFSSSYHKMFITDEATGMLNKVLYISSYDEGNQILSFAKSKLFIFVASRYRKTSGFTPFVKNNKIPDLRRESHWTDAELYEHFGLTQEEIDYIEENVK